MAKKDLNNEQIKLIDDLIRKGEVSKAQSEIDKASKTKISRTLAAPVAQLARRAGCIDQGLRILSPIVRPRNKVRTHPSANELLEYAILLQRNGSLKEAWTILDTPDLKAELETPLYKSYVLFNEWRYGDAIPFLESYVKDPRISEYSKLVGQVNLLAAYAFVENDEAIEKIYPGLRKNLAEKSHHRLLLNSFEILCSVQIRKLNFSEAEKTIETATQIHQEHSGLDSQYFVKWKLILEAYSKQSTENLFQFKEQAKLKGLSEIERDSDFHILKVKFDPSRASHLFTGTPYESYRQRLLRTFSGWNPPGDIYIWGKSGIQLSLADMTWKKKILFKPGSLQQRLLLGLCRDFYSWQSVGALHAWLFPEEYFDIDSSPKKIHQLVTRTRSTLATHQVPLEIATGPLGYKIRKSPQDLDLAIPVNGYDLKNKTESQLRESLGLTFFKRSEAEQVLGLSRSSTQRFLDELLEDSRIEAVGSGQGRMYRFKI